LFSKHVLSSEWALMSNSYMRQVTFQFSLYISFHIDDIRP
jgi:hypothetical protein